MTKKITQFDAACIIFCSTRNLPYTDVKLAKKVATTQALTSTQDRIALERIYNSL